MKTILTIIIILLAGYANAKDAEIKCYNGGKLIYHNNLYKTIEFPTGTIQFKDNNDNFIAITNNCVVIMPKTWSNTTEKKDEEHKAMILKKIEEMNRKVEK